MSDDASASSSSSEYEPEYEPEEFHIVHKASGTDIALEVLSVVPPPIEYMSEIHTQKVEISGRQVWCGSLGLAYFFCQKKQEEPEMFRNKRILELGSGTGILGMVASKNILGVPRCVALTDGDPLAVDLLKQNLQNPTNAIDQSMVKETRLLWGTDDTEGMSQFSKWCQTQWPELWPNNLQDDKNQQEENSSKTPSFDLIIAGDVLYKETLPLLFFQTVEALLDEDGTLWLCHVPRFNVTQEIVVDAATTAGFAMESHPLTDCDIPGCPLEDRERARIYRITKQLR